MLGKMFPTLKWIFEEGWIEGLKILGCTFLFFWVAVCVFIPLFFQDHVGNERRAAWRLYYHVTEVWPGLQRRN